MRRLLVLAALLLALGHVQMAQTPAWPHPIPARVRDGANADLFVMTLGDVTTPLADGTFDPIEDRVTLRDGSYTRIFPCNPRLMGRSTAACAWPLSATAASSPSGPTTA